MAQKGRTPGPLSSARATKSKLRRSRSACSDYTNVISNAMTPKPSAYVKATPSEHMSRNKLRTPMAGGRYKAVSADRNTAAPTSPSSPPMAFYRWPKPGELVVSKCGSPVMAQV